jgi:hypothetical protein
MKKSTENATVDYEPEKITDSVEIRFFKTVSGDRCSVHGKITKDGAEAGSVTYDSRNGLYIVSLKPVSSLTSEEQGAVLAGVHGCVSEILAD